MDPDQNFYSKNHCNSEYLLSDQLSEQVIRDKDQNLFSSLHFNARSLFKKFDHFVDYINLLDFQFHVIGFSETWLNDNSPVLSINNYSSVNKNRQGRSGGGVALYVHNSLSFFLRSDLSMDSDICDSLFLEIPRTREKNIIIGIIYKPPDSNTNVFVDAFDNVMANINRENKTSFIMGDFNIDLLKHSSHNPTLNFVNSIFSNSHLPLINRPTRITSSTATLIDNILSNGNNLLTRSGILINDLSDHLPVYQITFFSKSPCKVKNCNTSQFNRLITSERVDRFKMDLSNVSWNAVLNIDEPNLALNTFHSHFLDLYDKHFPVKKSISRRKLKTWMTNGVINSIKYKNKLYKKFISNPTTSNSSKYKKFRNKLNSTIKLTKANYYRDKFNSAKTNIKNTWNIINSLLNKNCHTNIPPKLNCGGQPTSDPTVIANAFNNYFTQVGPSLNKNIPRANTAYSDYLKDPNINSLFSPLLLKVKFMI